MFKCHHSNIGHTKHRGGVVLSLVLVAISANIATGCASSRDAKTPPSSTTATDGDGANGEAIRAAATDAAVQPLRDIGMVKRRIPPALARIGDPYAPPSGQSCEWIQYEIQQLDAALQGDVEAPAGHDDRPITARGGNIAREEATEAVRGVGSMLVPQRSLVRMLTGATKADRLYAEAEQRGMVRRGYLRGLADSKKC
ncbi:hypothetical protein [Aquidulcibacter sp.]|uniref:hypothetical protein n=1 Tax=Aquidulcibacter sp. TaxID=2052990 RepID=UPI0025C292E4|nr:hypothetical protein [Aquidulcibacter sp.]MCA3692062.1 hypothetical protein [Aquidulcibacter sp.]